MITQEEKTTPKLGFNYYGLLTLDYKFRPSSSFNGQGQIVALLQFDGQPEPQEVKTGIRCQYENFVRFELEKANPKLTGFGEIYVRMCVSLVDWQLSVFSTIRHLVRVGINPTPDMLNKLALNLDLCHES